MGKPTLSHADLEVAAHVWQTTGSAGLGHWLAEYLGRTRPTKKNGEPNRAFTVAEYGALVADVREHLGDETDYSAGEAPAAALRPGEFPIPEGEAPGACRSCGASIVWMVTEAGKRMPLSLATARRAGERRVALSHFADCPHGREWKQR